MKVREVSIIASCIRSLNLEFENTEDRQVIRNIDGSYTISNVRDRRVSIYMVDKSGSMAGYTSWLGNYWQQIMRK